MKATASLGPKPFYDSRNAFKHLPPRTRFQHAPEAWLDPEVKAYYFKSVTTPKVQGGVLAVSISDRTN